MNMNLIVFMVIVLLSVSCSNTKIDNTPIVITSQSEDFEHIVLFLKAQDYHSRKMDSLCVETMTQSINKGFTDFKGYHIRGDSYFYLNDFDKAEQDYDRAMKSMNHMCLKLINRKNKKALNSEKQVLLEKIIRRHCQILGKYFDSEKNEKVITIMLKIDKLLSESTSSEFNILIYYFISVIGVEFLKYDFAEERLLRIIKTNPKYYEAYPLLIQINYTNGNYDKAELYKTKLYKAKKKQKLPQSLSDSFCIEKFKLYDYNITVIERYETDGINTSGIFYKHIFKVYDSEKKLKYTVQSEYSPSHKLFGSPKYVICSTVGDTHYNHSMGFNEMEYKDLKQMMTKIITEKIELNSKKE